MDDETRQIRIIALAVVSPILAFILTFAAYNIYYLHTFHPVIQHTCSDTETWVKN